MPIEKDKLIYRIFRSEAEERGMDMKKFYHKRKKGLMPFLNSNGDVEWLKKNEFRVAAAQRVSYIKKSKKPKHHKHSRNVDDIDFAGLIPAGMHKYFFFGIAATVVAYLIVKLLAFLIMTP